MNCHISNLRDTYICFGIGDVYFALDAKYCMNIISSHNIHILDNKYLSNIDIDNVDDFFYFNNQIFSLVDLTDKLFVDDSFLSSYILMVLLDNRYMGIKISFDNIFLINVNENNIDIIEKMENDSLISSLVSYKKRGIEIFMLNLKVFM
jgi:hypothetical protein